MKKNRIYLIILVILLIITAYFVFTNTSSTISEELREFNVQDTAAIDKIFMADKAGNQVLLERKSTASWTLNGKYNAREDAIRLLLNTLTVMEVRSPVGKAARNHIIKDMAAKGVKVEIYQKGQLVKTFYVGGPTQDQMGTYMYLENSTVPFIMHIPGFEGYLTPRFIITEADWKVKTVFAFQRGEIANLVVENSKQPGQSFELTKVTDNTYQLKTYPAGVVQAYADSSVIQAYLAGYQFINYEKPLLNTAKSLIDSIVKSGTVMKINAKDINGTSTLVSLYLKPTNGEMPGQRDGKGKALPFDPDRMVARINNDTGMVVVQYFSFDKLMKTLDQLKNSTITR